MARKRKTGTTRRTAEHQTAVLARRTSSAAGAHVRKIPRGKAKRSAIADQHR